MLIKGTFVTLYVSLKLTFINENNCIFVIFQHSVLAAVTFIMIRCPSRRQPVFKQMMTETNNATWHPSVTMYLNSGRLTAFYELRRVYFPQAIYITYNSQVIVFYWTWNKRISISLPNVCCALCLITNLTSFGSGSRAYHWQVITREPLMVMDRGWQHVTWAVIGCHSSGYCSIASKSD